MAGGNDIRYNVKVDASGANRALTQFGRAASRAGKDAADALEDTATAGDKARAALTAMAAAMDAELREAAAAADALRAALGASADQFDADQIVADLNRMGVSFDDIRAEADQFAATMREVDGIRVSQINDGLSKTKTALDGVRDNADQSRSVLANLSGNAAQDLGALGGVAGTAGVALGQLAEYATEGNISLRNLAGVAGPMLGIAAATQIIASTMANIKATDAFNAEQVEDFAEAAKEGGDSIGTLGNHLRDIQELSGRVGQDGLLGGFLSREETVDAVAALAEFGVTLDDVLSLAGKSQPEMLKFRDAMVDAGISTDDANDAISIIAQTLINWETATKGADAANKFFAESVTSMGRSLSDFRGEQRATEDAWARLIDLQYNGQIRSEEGLALWNQLSEATGLYGTELAEVFDEKYNTFLDDQAAALHTSRDAAVEYDRVLRSADFGAVSATAASNAFGAYFDQFHAAGNAAQGQADAIDSVAEALTAAGEAGLDFKTTLTDFDSPEGRAVRDSMLALGEELLPEIERAYVDADGDQQQFYDNMANYGGRVLQRLQDELGISAEEASDLAYQFGLIPADVETLYTLAGVEEAKLKLDLLSGSIDALPKDVHTKVTQQILLGDYQGALRTIQNYYNANGATVPVDADVTKAVQTLRNLQAMARGMSLVLSAAGVRTTQSSASSAPVAAPRGLAAAPTAVAGPVNVHVHAAVVGNRYDVERVVAGAVHQSIRLAGRRQLVAR